MSYLVVFVIGIFAGIECERLFLRGLYKQMGFIRRQMRGGAKRRRR